MCYLHDEILTFSETDGKVVEWIPKLNEKDYIMKSFEEIRMVDNKIYLEAKRSLESDFCDYLSYAFQGLVEACKKCGCSVAELTRKLNESRYIFFDEFYTIPSTGDLLEEKLKQTRGKARRKICRQIRKWKKEKGKFLLSKKEIKECQNIINTK